MQKILEFTEIILLDGSYNTNIVLIGSLLLGVSAGLLGAFLLLFKRSLLGDTISHAAFPGIVLAFLFSHFFFNSEKILSILILGAILSSSCDCIAYIFLNVTPELQTNQL
jgi:manganese/zinc/iron transport system permease protein